MKTMIRFGVWITVLTAAACDSQEQRDVDEDVMACSAGRCVTNDSRTPAGGIVSTEGRVNQGGQQDEPAPSKRPPVAGMPEPTAGAFQDDIGGITTSSVDDETVAGNASTAGQTNPAENLSGTQASGGRPSNAVTGGDVYPESGGSANDEQVAGISSDNGGQPTDHSPQGGMADSGGTDHEPLAGAIANSTPCAPIRLENQIGSPGDFVRRLRIATGGTLDGDAVLVGNFDGHPNGRQTFAMARGSRVEFNRPDGRRMWQTEPLGIDRIVGVSDFDGDGRQEVLAMAPLDLHLFDVVTGQLKWSLPRDTFGAPSNAGFSTILVGDFTGDEVDDIYIADGGCADVGTGIGAVINLANGIEPNDTILLNNERDGGRCGRWHTAMDVDNDGRQDIIITDRRGLNAFDTLTGRKTVCGTMENAPPAGALPVLGVRGEAPNWFVFKDRTVERLEVHPDPENACDGRSIFQTTWASSTFDRIRPHGSTVLTGDEGARLLTSVWSAESASWRVVELTDDDERVLAEDAVLIDAQKDPQSGLLHALVWTGINTTAVADVGICALLTQAAVDGPMVETARLSDCRIPKHQSRSLHRTEEFTRPISLETPSGPSWLVIEQRSEEAGRAGVSRLLRARTDFTPWGQDLQASLNTVVPICRGVKPCGPDEPVTSAAVLLNDGRMGVLDPDGQLTNSDINEPNRPALNRPSGLGKMQIIEGPPRENIAFSTNNGNLMMIDPSAADDPIVWSKDLGLPRRGGSLFRYGLTAGGQTYVLARDPRYGESNISVFNGETGQLQWRHSPDETALETMRAIELAAGVNGHPDRVIRYDRVTVAGSRVPPEDCLRNQVVGQPVESPNPECPAKSPYPLLVSAYALETGECLWRTEIHPLNPCYGPSLQTLSVRETDGPSEIYITETRGIRRLDALTGDLLATLDLGTFPGGVGRGGGWIWGLNDPNRLLHIGTNGPPALLSPELEIEWRANEIDGLRNQSWIGRAGTLTPDELWITPAGGAPVNRYSLADGQLSDRFALRGGALINDPDDNGLFSLVNSYASTADIDNRQTPGTIISANDTYIYGMAHDGRLVWSKSLGVDVDGAVLVDVVDDDTKELVVPTANGELNIFGVPGLNPIPRVWDVPCDALAQCQPESDIDETNQRNSLCAEWQPLEGDAINEVRVISGADQPISDWRPVPGPGLIRIDELNLVPGLRYRIQMRRRNDATVSTSTASDGVSLVNASAPTIRLTADRQRFEPDSNAVTFVIHLDDDDQLAGWNADISNGQTGAHVIRLGHGPLSTNNAQIERQWSGRDRLNRLVDPGVYIVEVTSLDLSGNVGVATLEVEVCNMCN